MEENIMVATVNLSSSVLFHDAAEVERLVSAFETASISPADWKHRDHVAVATWYLLTRPGEAAAVDAMSESLKRFALMHGIKPSPGRGYHETLTVFWMKVINRYLETTNLDCSLIDLINGVVERFADKGLSLEYYSRALLDTSEARSGFIEPDLKSLDDGGV
jgi:hypothetical protein